MTHTRFINTASCISRQDIFCTVDYKYRSQEFVDIWKLANKLIVMLMKMTKEQLRLLLKVGFCMEQSPVAYPESGDRQHPTFQVCHGVTGPDNDYVAHHIPTPQEIDQNLVKLQKILSFLPEPKYITVSRSFRDGYTPKTHWKQIEDGILAVVNKTFPCFDKVHYDEDLLGGPSGWWNREAKFTEKKKLPHALRT